MDNKLFKRFKITFIFFFVLVIGLISFFAVGLNKYYSLREYFNQNSIKFFVDDDLDINKVNVYWYCAGRKGTLIKNGRKTKFVFKEYGKNRFTIVYGNDTVKTFTYFKTNNWHGHEHLLYFSKDDNKKINVEAKVFGPDTGKQKIF